MSLFLIYWTVSTAIVAGVDLSEYSEVTTADYFLSWLALPMFLGILLGNLIGRTQKDD